MSDHQHRKKIKKQKDEEHGNKNPNTAGASHQETPQQLRKTKAAATEGKVTAADLEEESESDDEAETNEETETDEDAPRDQHQKKNLEKEDDNITVEAVGDGTGSQKYAKRQYCIFCSEDRPPITRVDRHIERWHQDQPEVQHLQTLEKSSRERKAAFKELRNEGNFRHNIKVLKENEGTLIVVRRPGTNETISPRRFTPCLSCLGFFTKQDLCRHECRLSKGQEERQVLKNSREVLASLTSQSPEIARLLSRMKNEVLATTISGDWLLSKYCEKLLHKFSLTPKMDNQIRTKLSEMARLFHHLQESHPDFDFAEFFKPEHFDEVVSAVHALTGKGKSLKTPSLALKFGHGLNKCASIVIGQSLRKRDQASKNAAQDFLQLMHSEWSEKVSRHALETLHTIKFNKPVDLPLTEDLVKMVTKIRSEIESLVVQEDLDEKDFRRLAELTLCRIILFNKRRSGESSEVTVKAFEAAKAAKEKNEANQEILASLTAMEKQLANSLLLIEIRGKKGKKVPMLLSKDAQAAVEVLMKNRKKSFIPEANPYLFPIPGCSTALRGCDCLRKLTAEIGCQKPELITGTNLRKYLATTAQVMNLAENEVDWLARHLGHDVRVHREFYRMHESTVELAKISKLLIRSERGQAHELRGLSLEEIPEADLLEEDELPSTPDPQPSTSSSNREKFSSGRKGLKRPRSQSPDDDQHDPDYEPEEQNQPESTKKKRAQDQSREELFQFFETQIRSLKVPSKEEINNFIQISGSQLEWSKIKEVLNARVQREKRKLARN